MGGPPLPWPFSPEAGGRRGRRRNKGGKSPMGDNKEFLGTEPVGKLLFRLAVPTVVAQLINMLYNLVDRI